MNIVIDNDTFPINEVYQPIYKETINPELIQRQSYDRLQIILAAEKGFNNNNLFKGTISDWGCSQGFFSFNLSEHTQQQIYAIDNDIFNINVCNKIKEKHSINNINFIQGITPNDVPNSDGHIILSVLHHSQSKPIIPDNVLEKINDSKIIYFELAHCNEYPGWSNNLIPDKKFISPFHYWKEQLELQLPNFFIRLIGVTHTHLGSVRPIFQCKRKIKETFPINDIPYTIYEKFKMPYIDYGQFSMDVNGELHHNIINENNLYLYAINNNTNEKVFIKCVDTEIIKITPFIDGFLLNDIIKMGLLPYYDRFKIKKQLVNLHEKHGDPHPWNIIVDDNSNIHLIDTEFKSSSICVSCIPIYIQCLIQTI